jgi:hypothetical protein
MGHGTAKDHNTPKDNYNKDKDMDMNKDKGPPAKDKSVCSG